MSKLEQKALYVYTPGERAVFAEIYFPKKLVYQPQVFRSLRLGLDEERVRRDLQDGIRVIMQELKDYKWLFDPYQYEENVKGKKTYQPTEEDALKRVGMFKSYFKGWSMYEVDGVWSKNGGIEDERTQIIRIVFRLPSIYMEEAKETECSDVLRSILYWCIGKQGNLLEHKLWSKTEQLLFIKNHHPWVRKKLVFARKYFPSVAKEVVRWKHDCGLFIFGFLVHRFARNVLREKEEEKEIWVTNLFNLTFNYEMWQSVFFPRFLSARICVPYNTNKHETEQINTNMLIS